MLDPYLVDAWEVEMKRKLVLLVLSVVMLISLGCALPVTIARFMESRMGFTEKPYTIEPDPTDRPPGFDSGLGTVHFFNNYEPVQVNINYDTFIPGCIYYQAYADSGVWFSFDYNLDNGTFSGAADGEAKADEHNVWETYAQFYVSDITGTVSRAENGQDFQFSGTGVLNLTIKENARCNFQLGDATVTTKEEALNGIAQVSGKIYYDGNHWRWSPLIEYTDGSLSFSLRCINCDVTP